MIKMVTYLYSFLPLFHPHTLSLSFYLFLLSIESPAICYMQLHSLFGIFALNTLSVGNSNEQRTNPFIIKQPLNPPRQRFLLSSIHPSIMQVLLNGTNARSIWSDWFARWNFSSKDRRRRGQTIHSLGAFKPAKPTPTAPLVPNNTLDPHKLQYVII